MVDQIRGLLAEHGIILPPYVGQVCKKLPAVLEDAENQLTGFGRRLFNSHYEELAELEEKIEAADRQIELALQCNADSQRIAAWKELGR